MNGLALIAVLLMGPGAADADPPTIALKPLQPGERPKPASGPMAAGVHRSLSADSVKRGRWMRASGGSKVWRLAIKSPGAEGLRVHFRDFAAGQGIVTVRAAGGAKPEGTSPYTGSGPNRDGDFWSDIVFADTIVIEYKPAASARASGTPPFRIPEITHMWPR